MSAVLPTGTALGQLEIEETYFAYEGPRFFCARSRGGRRYVAIAVDEDEDSDQFLYLPVSDGRFTAVRSGLIGLRQAFVEAEDEQLFVVTVRYDHTGGPPTYELSMAPSADVPEAWLPADQARLTLDTPTHETFSVAKMRNQARAENRSLIALRLPTEDERTEYSVSPLASLIGDVQSAVTAFGQEASGNPTETGPIPEIVATDTELALVELRAASFVAVLAPRRPADVLFEPALAASATENLIEVLSTVGDPAALRSALEPLHRRAVSKVREILEGIVDRSSDLEVFKASPAGSISEAQISVEAASSGLGTIREDTQDVSEVVISGGTLIGANLRTKTFEVHAADGTRYAGKVDPDALDEIEGMQVGAEQVDATILMVHKFGAFSGQPTVKYRLVRISPSGSSR